MNCPWCPFEGHPRALHAHLGEAHPGEVVFEDRIGRTFYGVTCPHCGDGYRHEIKPRGRDPGFVDEFEAQIRLVAFDMLVNHLLVEHDPEVVAEVEPGPPPDPEPPAPGGGPAWLAEARRKSAGTGSES